MDCLITQLPFCDDLAVGAHADTHSSTAASSAADSAGAHVAMADPASKCSPDEAYARRCAEIDMVYVETPHDLALRKQAKQLMLETNCPTGRLLLVTGAEGSGRKATIRRLSQSAWLSPYESTDSRKQHPFVEIDARAQTQANRGTIVDAVAGVDAGAPAMRIQNDRKRLHYAAEDIVNRGLRLIAITHAEHMLNGKDVNAADAVAGRISVLMRETKASFILTGGNRILDFVRAREFGAEFHYPIEPISGVDEVLAFIEAFEGAGDLQPNPRLRDPLLLSTILDMTFGLRGRIAQWIGQAVKGAVFDDVEMLTVQHLLTTDALRVHAKRQSPLVAFL